jgi:hypothetical protein
VMQLPKRIERRVVEAIFYTNARQVFGFDA